VRIGRAGAGWEESFSNDIAEIALINDGWVTLEREGRAYFVMPSRPSDEELIHPWLATVASTFNLWHGRHVLHGGVVVSGGRAVAVIGDREYGKSSLLAWMARDPSIEILADDLVIIEEGRVLAGPRCIDLRPGAAEALSRRGDTQVVRDAERLRLRLPQCSADAPLAAIVVLEWSDGPGVSITPLGATEALEILLNHALDGGAHGRLLELLDVPVWRLCRPRSWDIMSQAARELVRVARMGQSSKPRE
jgi:hypothetical protein